MLPKSLIGPGSSWVRVPDGNWDLNEYVVSRYNTKPELIAGTQDWENEIREAIPSSICIVYLASESARKSSKGPRPNASLIMSLTR